MKAVKALVAGMAILIVAGIGLLAYGMMTKVGKPRAERAPRPAAASAGPLAPPPLNEPAGTRVTGMAVGDNRLVLSLDGGGRGARVAIIDLSGTTPTATVEVSPPAPAP